MRDLRKFYINGQWQDPTTAHDLSVINPANESPVAVISLGAKADVDKAVKAARHAFIEYSQTTLEQRIAYIEKFLSIYKRRYEEMAQAISTEMGAPIQLARDAQADTGVGHTQAFIESLKKYQFESKHNADGVMIRKEPVGVCGLITPWNWPINQISLKVWPALGVGCTVVLKPSEIAPLSAMLFAEMVDEAGFPAGVFNLVNGDGPGVGEAMSNHPDIDMMSFTGSTRAGCSVTRASADTVKRVALELGGKSPNVIFADSDLESAVKSGVIHCFENTGQSCNAPTRMIVEQSVYEQVVAMAVEIGKQVKVGDPSQEGNHIGPLISAQHFDKVQSLIKQGIDEGATLALGGLGKPEGFEQGYYVKPTIFTHVNNQMHIAREEVFGPVLVIIPFKDEADAVSIANDTPYGLAAYLHTTDKERGQRIAKQLRAGMVRLNGRGLGYGTPFGGYKMSGLGREGGEWGIEDFLEVKAVSGWDES